MLPSRGLFRPGPRLGPRPPVCCIGISLFAFLFSPIDMFSLFAGLTSLAVAHHHDCELQAVWSFPSRPCCASDEVVAGLLDIWQQSAQFRGADGSSLCPGTPLDTDPPRLDNAQRDFGTTTAAAAAAVVRPE